MSLISPENAAVVSDAFVPFMSRICSDCTYDGLDRLKIKLISTPTILDNAMDYKGNKIHFWMTDLEMQRLDNCTGYRSFLFYARPLAAAFLAEVRLQSLDSRMRPYTRYTIS